MAGSDEPPTASAGGPSALERSRSALDSGEPLAGLQAAAQAHDEALARGDGRGVAKARLLAAKHLARLGRFDEAEAAAGQAVEQWRALADAAGECDALCERAVACLELARHEAALHSTAEACALLRKHDLGSLSASVRACLGLCHVRWGNAAQGALLLTESLELARESRSTDDSLLALARLAASDVDACRSARRRGDLASAAQAAGRARSWSTQALALADRLHNPFHQATAGSLLAEVCILAGEFDEAKRLLDAALERALAGSLSAVETAVRASLAELHAARGEGQRAIDELTALLGGLPGESGMSSLRMRLHAALWTCARELGRFDLALTHCEACYAIDMQLACTRAQACAALSALTNGAGESAVRAMSAPDAAGELKSAHGPASAASPLPDDGGIERELRPLFDQVKFRRKPLALAAVEVDGLAALRARVGAAGTSAALRELGSLMRQRLRGRDLALRRGPEGFLLVLGDTPPAAAQAICERVRAAVGQHDWSRLGPGTPVTVSVGLVNVAAGREPAGELARAEEALRGAQSAGGNRVHTASTP